MIVKRINDHDQRMDFLPPSIPVLSSFDPAIHLHSDQSEAVILSSHAQSDDWEAIRLQQAEATAAKNKERIVIQHRAWPVGEAFRSDEVHKTGMNAILMARCLLKPFID